jgi:GDP-4-dehydro-6-deoxy-D-mannose reductase
MRALITGVTGFAGRALALHLAARGWGVVGSYGGRRPVPPELSRAGIRLVTHNLGDAGNTRAMLRDARPGFVFHLAGQTGVDFTASLNSYVAATVNLLEAARHQSIDAVMVIPGSSAQFGDVPESRQPITEDTEYRPSTPYGIAKAREAWTAARFHREYGMKIIRTHTFNCIGPGQRPQFVPATFACQIAAMERGTVEPVLKVGNLDTRRDMTDIRDVADAYFRAATRGRPGQVYNICSGQATPIGALVARLHDISQVDFEVCQELARLQTIDVPTQRGDASRLYQDTGWRPSMVLDQTLADVLEEWRAIV